MRRVIQELSNPGEQTTPGDATSTATVSPEDTTQRKRRGDREEELNPIDRMGREQRIPIGRQSRIKFAQRKGYVRRVVNDVNDGERVEMFRKAGWKIVTENTAGGDTRAGADTQVGAPVSRSVGGGIRGVLMEIPEEFYNEDQAAKQAQIDKTMESIKRKPKEPGNYGDIKIT